MLKIAVPNKGSLSEGSVALLKDAGYNCRRSGRELSLTDTLNNVEFIFLRPRDIAVCVAKGIIDLGITGRDLMIDSKAAVEELMALGFGKAAFRYAAPSNGQWNIEKLSGKRIATSYPNLVASDLQKHGLEAEIIKLDGAVEISIRLDVADAIADVVESGRTLQEAGLEVFGEPILKSEAILIGRNTKALESPEAKSLVARLTGMLVARDYAMIEYDIPRCKLEQGCAVTPGIESPTVAPLSNSDWAAVKAMIHRGEINTAMDSLEALGARGIIVTDIRTCRL